MKIRKILVLTMCISIISICFKSNVIGINESTMILGDRNGNTKKIALTFDDGPHPRYTKQILDILSEYGITATFFVVGVNVKNYPDNLRQIAESGCEIGNHTYSHQRIDKLDDTTIENEIRQCEEIIFNTCGKRPSVFRPPQGFVPSNFSQISKKMGYSLVLWDVDTMDWALNPSKSICTTVISNLRGGDIILMHDYVSGGNTTCEALRMFIPRLLERGYAFVTVSELLCQN